MHPGRGSIIHQWQRISQNQRRLGKATAEEPNLVSDPQNKQSQMNQMAKFNQPEHQEEGALNFHKNIYDLHGNLKLKMYTDQTGRFPVQFHQGNQYIMVLFKLGSNSILVEAMQN